MPHDIGLERRLFARREIDSGRECWLWTGRCETREGYGKIKIGGRKGKFRKVHRVAAMLWLDIDLDDETQVLHRCDVRRCFNPKHLYGGDNAQNIRDRADRKRGREHRQQGAGHHGAKLTDDDVREIRRLAASGHRQQALANRFGVKQPAISKIVLRHTWSHLD